MTSDQLLNICILCSLCPDNRRDGYPVIPTLLRSGLEVFRGLIQPPSGRSNGAKGENVVMRSVPSDGPAKVAATEKKAKTDGKQKARVQTARTRRAAKQQVGLRPDISTHSGLHAALASRQSIWTSWSLQLERTARRNNLH